jgi:glutamine synthetase
MSRIRFNALYETFNRKPLKIEPIIKRSEIFGQYVFSDEKMKDFLDKNAYVAVQEAILKGKKIDRSIAEQIAAGMKNWAISQGATHYTHWFQPLTGATAEKHDSFFELTPDGQVLEKFSGSQLVQQEPDASSFPNGGIRNTFEARGYTAWDPTSPAFIYGTTLCIPTVFVSYTGEALDVKTPLLRSLQALDQAATAVSRYFHRDVHKVIATLGWEQEYFLIDAALYKSRPDLVMTGRTLLGHPPARGQQLDDHYFGSIPERVMAFMRELEIESLKLGIPVKTRHNEVAPNQFELAPVFEEANLAVDHNSLLMDIMRKIARKHNFEVLLHEKPFAGINGSGKHNNWSMMTDTGINLLSPGKTPMKNLEFLVYFINTIKAVNDNEKLLRAAIASAGNDHRLGANEAPPAIISVFIGTQLTNVLQELKNVSNGKLSPKEKTDLKLNVVGKIPEILLDNTDRNRTSPFAFTGNRFEFRAVGSSANTGNPMMILNMIVAKQLKNFKKEVDTVIKNNGLKKDEAIFNVLRDYIKQSERILFEGDGYSKTWEKEAEKRGLSNLKTTPEALKSLIAKESIALFEEMNVLNRREVEAKYEVELEQYTMKILIEAGVLGDLTMNHVVPAALKYQQELVQVIKGLKEIYNKDYKTYAKEPLQLLNELSESIAKVSELVRKLRKNISKLNDMDLEKKASVLAHKIKPEFDKIRRYTDQLEMMIDDEIWPLTKYREMLFIR